MKKTTAGKIIYYIIKTKIPPENIEGWVGEGNPDIAAVLEEVGRQVEGLQNIGAVRKNLTNDKECDIVDEDIDELLEWWAAVEKAYKPHPAYEHPGGGRWVTTKRGNRVLIDITGRPTGTPLGDKIANARRPRDDKELSGTGANPYIPDMTQKTVDKHWVGGDRDHSAEYPEFTRGQYVARANRL